LLTDFLRESPEYDLEVEDVDEEIEWEGEALASDKYRESNLG